MHGSHHYKKAEELLAELDKGSSTAAAAAHSARAMAHIELAKLSFAIDGKTGPFADRDRKRWLAVEDGDE